MFSIPSVVSADISPDIYQENCTPALVQERLSSDLLSLIDDTYCLPQKSSREVMREMHVFNQIRYDAGSHPLVHVQISLKSGTDCTILLPFVRDFISDDDYGLISGWVYVTDLVRLACNDGVIMIHPVLPPTTGGLIMPVSNPDEDATTNVQILQSGNENTNAIPENSSDIHVPMVSYDWEQKLSTDLRQVMNSTYCSPGQLPEDVKQIMAVTGQLRYNPDKDPEVLVSARLTGSDVISQVTSRFSDFYVDTEYKKIEGWVSLSSLSSLAQMMEVSRLQTILPPKTSSIVTPGDILHRSMEFRNMSGFSGSDIRVGVISDGVTHLDVAIAAGELPESVVVLKDSVGGDEGTAMLEIIHDIAPEAELYFHDRGTSPIAFVKAMDTLIQAGCQVICDDIIYVEPFFEDGYIAENVRDRILTYDIVYVTAAGNAAQGHYQSEFNGTKVRGYKWHSFSKERETTYTGMEDARSLYFTIPPYGAGHVVLQWDDPFLQSANNYDLFLFDSEGYEIARSVNVQDGDDDPIEWCRFVNTENKPEQVQVRVVQAEGVDKEIEIYVLPLYDEMITTDPHTISDSIYAQQAVPEVICVGAADMGKDGSVTVESFSSQGPVSIRYPQVDSRKKPDVVAINRVLVSNISSSPYVFTGTSASAPHIAGICADIMSVYPYADSSAIRAALLASATDIGPPGWDPASGYGLPDAVRMAQMIPPAPPDVMDSSDFYTAPTNLSSDSVTWFTEFHDEIPLSLGWNLISIPYSLESGNDTAEIFSCVDTDDHTIWRFPSQKEGWIPVRSDDMLMLGVGYWIYSSDPCSIPLTPGTVRDLGCGKEALSLGWHMLGFIGTDPIPARTFMESCNQSWSHLFVFDRLRQESKKPIIKDRQDQFSDSRLLYPGDGFWCYTP